MHIMSKSKLLDTRRKALSDGIAVDLQREGVHCPYEPPDTLQDHMNGGAFRPCQRAIILKSFAEKASKRLFTKRVYNTALRDAILLRAISPRPADFSFSRL